jgi:hypothetical protein
LDAEKIVNLSYSAGVHPATGAILIKKHNGWQMLPDKGTDPCVYYVG